MNNLIPLRKHAKISLISVLILLVYGYSARHLSFYFLGESNSLGYALLLIGLISLLADSISIKKSKTKKRFEIK